MIDKWHHVHKIKLVQPVNNRRELDGRESIQIHKKKDNGTRNTKLTVVASRMMHFFTKYRKWNATNFY